MWGTMRGNAFLGVSLAALVGCAGSTEKDNGANGGSAGASGTISGSGGSSQPDRGGSDGGGHGGTEANATSAGGGEPVSDAGGVGGAGGQQPGPGDLPEGSSEYQGIVNLVDADAAADLDAFLSADPLVSPRGLARPWNLFVEHYYEAYDFVFFVTDDYVSGATVAAKLEAVNRPPIAGTGNDFAVELAGYRSDGTLKGVIGVAYQFDDFPPLSHELVHYWAVHLDTRFNFGASRHLHYGPHWGFSSVNGQLGGFDASTLRCETPAGALPPDCTPGSAGVTRYVVGEFGADANGFRNQPYAPLELYLMGLGAASDVPESFMMLDDAAIDESRHDEAAGTVVVEASSLTTLPFADIVARHGSVERLPEPERHFKAAFVVVSANPAPEWVMQDVAEWAAVFGNRSKQPPWKSFEEDTGGLATLDTVLGPRRDPADPPPPERERFECDPLAQDCGDGLGCYLHSVALCALNDGLERGEPCDVEFACAPGLDCVASADVPDDYSCEPYCDAKDPESPLACDSLCPDNYFNTSDANGVLLASLCLP